MRIPFPLVLIMSLAIPAAFGQTAQRSARTAGPAPADADLTRLADGVYVRISSPDGDAVANAGIVVLESGILVFDTHFTPEAGEVLAEKIRALSTKPVRYLVNSHYHADHTHGNQVFQAARLILGSINTRRAMLDLDLPKLNRARVIAQGQVEQLSKELSQGGDAQALRVQLNQRQAYLRRLSAMKILPPDVTFDDSVSLVDGREAQLFYLGPGHTDGDIVLYLPQEKIAFLGDLFFKDGIPNVEDANIGEWMKTLREALKLDARIFVPGHGQPGTRADVEKFLSYFVDLKALVEPAIERGDSLEQLVQDTRIPAQYASYNFQNLFPANLQRMYAELKDAAPDGAESKEKGKKK
jgi:glyoxylase-like metal-dependent hydrolase (beta-lactamase superfamily II)